MIKTGLVIVRQCGKCGVVCCDEEFKCKILSLKRDHKLFPENQSIRGLFSLVSFQNWTLPNICLMKYFDPNDRLRSPELTISNYQKIALKNLYFIHELLLFKINFN
jgi:hypothetical protein